MVTLDRSNESCSTCIDDLSSEICVSNNTEDVSINVSNTTSETKESKTLTKPI